MFSVGLYPLFEGRLAIIATVRAIIKDLSGRKLAEVIEDEGTDFPPSGTDAKLEEKIAEKS